jgi:hypothetical protein
MAFKASSNDCRSVWFVSFASKKLGEDMDAYSCRSLELGARPRFCTYAATLLMMAKSAG